MTTGPFIQVIIPLKLEWEPCYVAMDPIEVGDRVRVNFSNKEYIAVVSGVDVQPEVALDKVKPILGVEKDMERILTKEIELWKTTRESLYSFCRVQAF